MKKEDMNTIKRPEKTRYITSSFVLLLFLLSIGLVACGPDANSLPANSNPVPTITIDVSKSQKDIPNSPMNNLQCGAWVTDATPPYLNGQARFGANGRFVQLVNGNPQGVAGATVTATITWGDYMQETQTKTTNADGFVVFELSTANHFNAIGKNSLITMNFNKDGLGQCKVGDDRPAFFTLTNPTPTQQPSKTPTCTPGKKNCNKH